MANNPRSTRRDRSDNPPSPGDETTGGDQKSEFKKPSFWIGVATLLVVGGYTYFAHQQVRETQTANTIAKKALAEANKPYVMWSSFTPHYSIENGNRHLRMGVTWTNYGNTPADFVRVFMCDPIVRTDFIEPEFHCNLSDSEEQTPVGIIGPKQPYPVNGPIVQESDMEATVDEKKAVYIFGYVTYQDAIDFDDYGNPEQRTTRFCYRISLPRFEVTTPGAPTPEKPNAPPVTTVVNPPPGSPITAIIVAGCRKFSCMDATCKPLH